MNELNVIGLNHKTAPVALRERFAFNPEQQVAELKQFHIQGCPHELILLSTCNRTEIIFAGAESQIAAVEENKEAAINLFRDAVDAGWSKAWYARIDPIMADLREDTRFLLILEELEARLSKMRENQKMLASNEP